MAESAVYFLIEKLTILLSEKVTLFKGVRKDFEYVRDELERMIAFLRVADGFEESDPEIKVWVKQVREIANDTEDVIDEFLLHSTLNHGRHGIHGFLGKLYSSLKNFIFTPKVASEIRSKISRVRNIAEGHQRYRYKLSIQEQGSSSGFVDYSASDRRGDALLLEEGELVGIEHHKQNLIRLLIEEDLRLKVISVVGMGGLGKTTLVKRLFDDPVVKKHFQNHAWLTVSQLFKIEDLLKDTIQQLFDEIKQPLPEGTGSMNSNRRKEIIREFLRGRRYVLVFDDVWSIPAWEAIKYALPNENHGSRIILTTRLINVASSACIETNGFVYELNPLSKEESWTLFCQKTFQGNSCPHHLIEICSNILRNCGGLPLAIVSIGGLLATKNMSRAGEWEMLNHSLGPELEGNDALESMKNILLLSFNDLPYYLKPCFLFLSIYPEDHLIEHNTLIRLWIVEGFVKQKEGRTVEEVAEGYLNELINRSLIVMAKTNDDGSLKYGQIHDLYREVILSKAREQNLVTNNEQKTMWPRGVRRLSIHNTLEHVKKERYGTRARSFLTFGVTDVQSMLNILQLLSSFRMLKVLSLKDVPLPAVPKLIFTMLHLKHLSLRNTKVKVLPGSIKKLKMLETLDLKQTYITELPVEILELHHLSHLLLYRHVVYSYLPYDCPYGFKAIKGMGRLISLRKLGYMEASCGSDTIKEISMMTELRRLCLTKLRREDGMAVCSSIEKLHNLRSLSLKSTEEDEVLDLQYLSSPPRFLQKLYLTGCIEKFPIWIQSLHNLIKVYFRWSKLRDDPLQYLQDLPNLVHLEFLVGFTGEELCFKAGKFQRLKLLNFDKLESLRRVVVEEGAMPHLEKLVIQRSNSLERIPQGIEHLIELKVVEFFDMPDEFITTMDPHRLGEDYCKVAHIPEVYYTFWRDGGWEIYSLEQSPADMNFQQPRTVIRTQGRRNSL